MSLHLARNYGIVTVFLPKQDTHESDMAHHHARKTNNYHHI
jgi:hypothetical protein